MSVVDQAQFLTRRAMSSARHPRMVARVAAVHRDRRAMARSYTPGSPRPRTLAYHSIEQPDWGVNDTSVAQLRRHLDLARAMGYRFVPASEIPSADHGERVLAVTFDDGLRSVVDLAAPLLAEQEVPWTMFVTTDWADGCGNRDIFLSWDEIGSLQASGVTIGSHSKAHPDFGDLDEVSALDDLSKSAERFRVELGSVPVDFAIPLGTSRNWTPTSGAVARSLGHDRIWSQSEDNRAPETLPRSLVAAFDIDRIFLALLEGGFDGWEEPAG